ncbi:MAG: hypothetical protein AAFY56_01285 [Pseudomonadota bacterium]
MDRLEHLLWAGAFFLVIMAAGAAMTKANPSQSLIARYWIFVSQTKGFARAHLLVMVVFVMFLGSWLPDVDWLFNQHRSPVTHSAIPYLLLAAYIGKPIVGNRELSLVLLPIFGVALGSHLIVDHFQGGNLVGVPAVWEIAFLMGNGALVIWLSCRRMKITVPPNFSAESPPVMR